MNDVTVMFSLPGDTLDALQAKAHRDGVAPGAIIRTALARSLKDRQAGAKSKPTDPILIRALRTLVAKDLEAARSWSDLEARLSNRGYTLRTDRGALLILGKDTGEVVCQATDIGTSYGALIRRFDGPLMDQEMAQETG